MRPTACAAAAAVFCAASAAGECEVLFRYDFDGEEARPKAFTSGGEYPHPENNAMGQSAVLTNELDYEGKKAGRCVVLRAGRASGEPWYGGRELWYVAGKIPALDLRLSVCIYTEDVKAVQLICPVDGANDNCYNLSVRVRHEGKVAGAWVADPRQFLDDREWGTVTWRIFENRFNATHVRINPEMHEIGGFRLHPSGWGDDERTAVAVDNLVLYRGEDTSPPAAVDDLSASASKGVVELAWSRPEDNLFAVGYDVYRSAAPGAAMREEYLLARVHTTHFADETIVNPGAYHYRVVAHDYAGNRSAPSNAASIRLDDDGRGTHEGRSERNRPEGARRPASIAPIAPKIHRGAGWAVAAPADWRVFPLIRRPTVLHLIGDGKTGIPHLDGAFAPLQIGLHVEVFEAGAKTPREMGAELVNGLKAAKGLKPRSEPMLDEVQLSDGTPAVALVTQVDKVERGRFAYYRKLLCSGADERLLVVTGFVVCGRASRNFVRRTGIIDFLQAHVDSFVLHGEKLDEAALREACSEYDRRIPGAVAKALEGNRHLEDGKYAEAKRAYSRALETCAHVSAAHNGLAWTCLTSTDPEVVNVADALRHAEIAVEQTERRDPASLDTLALAYFVAGRKEEAISTIRDAIEISPNDQSLRKQLEKYSSSR